MTFENFTQMETPKVTNDWGMLTNDERKLKLNKSLNGSISKGFFTVTRTKNHHFPLRYSAM